MCLYTSRSLLESYKGIGASCTKTTHEDGKTILFLLIIRSQCFACNGLEQVGSLETGENNFGDRPLSETEVEDLVNL